MTPEQMIGLAARLQNKWWRWIGTGCDELTAADLIRQMAEQPAPQPDDSALLRKALEALINENSLRNGYRYRGGETIESKADEVIEVLRARLDGAPQPARVPMTDEQIDEMISEEQFLLVCDGKEELTLIIRAVEHHHGIRSEE